MRIRSVVFIFILAFTFYGFSAVKQVRFIGLGEASCRAIGMGEAYVAVSDDAAGAFWNPAGLAYIEPGKRYAEIMLKANLRNELTYDSIAFTGQSYEEDDTVDFTIGDYLQNKMQVPNEEKKVNYNFAFGIIGVDGVNGYNNTNLFFSAAKAVNAKFGNKESRLSGGVKLRYSSYDNYVENGVTQKSFHETTIGFGAIYNYSDFLRIGLMLDNVFKDSPYDVPTIVSIGFAFIVDPTTIISADGFNIIDTKSLDNNNQDDTEFRVGVEKRFLDNGLILRFGSKNGNLNLGFSMKVTDNFELEYAYMGDYDEDINQHFVGARVTF